MDFHECFVGRHTRHGLPIPDDNDNPLTVTETFRRLCNNEVDSAWISLTTVDHVYFDRIREDDMPPPPPSRPPHPKTPQYEDEEEADVFTAVFEDDDDMPPRPRSPKPLPPPPPVEAAEPVEPPWYHEPPGDKPVFRNGVVEANVVAITLTWVARTLRMPIPISKVVKGVPMRTLDTTLATRLRDDLIEDREGIVEWARDLWEAEKT